MKFTTLIALVATSSAVKIGNPNDFNYDSTGGHASVKSLPSTPPTLNGNARGTDTAGNTSNTDTRGNPVIEKKLAQNGNPNDFNYDSTGGHSSVKSLPSTPPTLNGVARGTDTAGNTSNTDTRGNPVIEKKLAQNGNPNNFNYDSTGGHAGNVWEQYNNGAPTGGALNGVVRGTEGANRSNTNNDGTPVIEKKLAQAGNPNDFNYDSTGGHSSVKSLPSTPPALNGVARGTDTAGNTSNTDTRGNPVIEKK
tara:strand:+ start:73 stop:825 length:753 start_codon:yes stop_codon:yes gene_type:complete